MDVRLPDGTIIRNVPEGTTRAQLADKLTRGGYQVPQEWMQPAQRPSLAEQDPSEYDPSSPEWQAKYGATSGMNPAQRFFAGAGKAMVDVGRGVGQLFGAVDRTDMDSVRQQDAALMRSGFAKAGNILGGVATAAPAMAIPGANTVVGAGLVGAAYGAAQPVASNESRTLNTAVGGATGAAAQYLGGKVSQWAANKISNRASTAASKQAQNVVRDTTLREAQKAGYVVPPSTTNPTVINRTIEGIAGKAQTHQVAAVKNQQVTNQLARRALGLGDDTPLTKATLNAVRSKAGNVYRAIESAGDIVVDGQYIDDLAAIAQAMDDVAKDFPDLNLNNNEQVSALVDGLLRDKFAAKSAIEATKQLRKAASGNLSGANAADPAKRALGYAQRDAAAAIEDQLVRHLKSTGKAALAENFDKSRMLIAKTYSVEAALNEGTGNVVAKNLGAQLKKGKPLTGELETIAKFAQSFGKSAQEITDSPAVSAVDWIIGGLGAAGVDPTLIAVPVARQATRSALTTSTVNRVMATPNYAPGKAGTALLQGAKAAGRGAAVPSIVYATQQ